MFETSATIFGIPRSHWHCHFSNFDWPSQAVKNAVVEFMGRQLVDDRRGLLLTGGPGLGKTHLAVALYRWSVLHWGTADSSLVIVPDFFSLVKENFNHRGEDPFAEVEQARRMIVLDDPLGRTPSPWEIDNIIFRLIHCAYNNNAALVVTANQTLDQIATYLKPHEMSRLLSKVTHIEFKGKDRR